MYERFEIAVRVAKMGVFVWDLKKDILSWNDGMFPLYDVCPDKFNNIYQKWSQRLHPEDRVQAENDLKEAIKNNREFQTEFRIIIRDGSVRHIRSSGLVLNDDDGYPYQITGLNWDVTHEYTEKKIITDELDHANEVIKQTQHELFQAQKMDALGKLAGGIAHDFNNLIGGILGYADMLQKTFQTQPGFEDVSRKLSLIHQAAERGRDLTKALLGFARKGNYEKIVFSVNVPILETIELLNKNLNTENKIRAELDSDLWNIVGDSTQIFQVIMNLGLNAQYAIQKEGEILFTAENIDITKGMRIKLKPGRYVLVKVVDTGVGMSKETCAKIFDPFFTTKPLGEGTGFGLSLSYGIIENHGGAIFVDSILNIGSTFYLYLPASEQPSSDRVETIEEPRVEQLNFEKSILIVDDDLIILEMLGDIMKIGKKKTFLASSGEEALTIFKDHSHEIGLALLDVVMPEMDGIAVYRELSKINPSINVIFLSGYAQADSISELRSQEQVGFIQKPFTNEDLAKYICFRGFNETSSPTK